MIIKDISDNENRILKEEQIVDNQRFSISDMYVPSVGLIDKRITVSTIDESSFEHYEEIHGLKLIDGKIRSIYLVDDKNKSTHDSYFLEDDLAYYDEVISSFQKLINSNNSEFSLKAVDIFNEIKNSKNKGAK